MTDILVVNEHLDNEENGSWLTLDEAKQLTRLNNPVILNWVRLKTLPERRNEKGVRLFDKNSLLALAESKPKRGANAVQHSGSPSVNTPPAICEDDPEPAPDFNTGTVCQIEKIPLPTVAAESATEHPLLACADFAVMPHTNEMNTAVPNCDPVGHSRPGKEIASSLSPEEYNRLQSCEETVREGLGKFVAVGIALMEIRDARLYRQSHATFEAYVQSVLALSRPRAYEIIDSAQVMSDLSGIADIHQLPMNEGQARELHRWKTPEARVENWRAVLAAAGDQPLTAKFIRQTLRPVPSPITASAANKTTRQAKVCLARLRRLMADNPVGGPRVLELIAELEGILSDEAAGAPG